MEPAAIEFKGIRVVALDVFGTVLSNFDEQAPPRKGLETFLQKCKAQEPKVKVVTTSDDHPLKVVYCLRTCFERHNVPHLIDLIDGFIGIELLEDKRAGPSGVEFIDYKDFLPVITAFKILSQELLVIGDLERDSYGAKKAGAQLIQVPPYNYAPDNDSFDFSRIDLKTGRYLKCQ
jgi:hypothetical protein